ncbi:MAG: hypothetical protein R3254_08735 [Thiomicrorhabdus sp.]|nr:hypothetical protein [Thiomicrorhabdus sp.]
MPNEFDTLFAGVRDELATLGGKSITLKTPGGSTYNPTTGTTTVTPATESTVKARIGTFDISLIGKNDIQIDDLQVDIYTATALDTSYTLVIDGTEHAIVKVIQRHYAVEDIIYQTVQAR